MVFGSRACPMTDVSLRAVWTKQRTSSIKFGQCLELMNTKALPFISSKAEQCKSLWPEIHHQCSHMWCILNAGGGHMQLIKSLDYPPKSFPLQLYCWCHVRHPCCSHAVACGILFSLGCPLPALALRLLSAGFSFMQTLDFLFAALYAVWYFKPHLLQFFLYSRLSSLSLQSLLEKK